MEKDRGRRGFQEGRIPPSCPRRHPPQELTACIFCYKSVDLEEVEPRGGVEIRSRFFKLLERHLSVETDHGRSEEKTNDVRNEVSVRDAMMVTSTCEDCFVIVDQFCRLYHQLKCLELRISWKVWSLRNIMNAADRIQSRRENFRDALSHWAKDLEEHHQMEHVDRVKHFRKDLVKKCSRKLLHFPRVSMKRYSPLVELYEPCPVAERDVILAGETSLKIEISSDEQQFYNADDDGVEEDCPTESRHTPKLRSSSFPIVRNKLVQDESEIITSQPPPPPPSSTSIRVIVKSSSLPQEDGRVLEEEMNLSDCSHMEAIPVPPPRLTARQFETVKIKFEATTSSSSSAVVANFDPTTPMEESSHNSDSESPPPRCSTNEAVEESLQSQPPENQNVEANINNIPSNRRSLRLIGRRHACSKCRMIFTTPARLEAHAKTHAFDALDRRITEEEAAASSDDEDEPEPSIFDPESETENLSDHEEEEASRSSSDYESLVADSDSREVISESSTKKPEYISAETTHQELHSVEATKDPEISKLLADIARGNWLGPSAPQHFCPVKGCKEEGGFYLEEELENHSTLHGNFPCNFCDSVKSYAPILALHEANKHPSTAKPDNNKDEDENKKAPVVQPQLQCSRCPFSISSSRAKGKSKSSFLKHFLGEHLNLKVDSFMCPICKLRLNTRTNRKLVRNHVRQNHDMSGLDDPSQIQKCDQCPAVFRTELQLETHRAKLHPTKLTCSLCPRWFASRCRLRQHKLDAHKINIVAQTDLFRFQCSHHAGCNAGFDTLLELNRHLRNPPHHHKQHNNIKSSSSAPTKQKSKSNIKPKKTHHQRQQRRPCVYPCNQCQRRFSSIQTLREHKKIHRLANGEQVPPAGIRYKSSYPCSFCAMKYKRLLHLRQHIQKFHGGGVTTSSSSPGTQQHHDPPPSSCSTVPPQEEMVEPSNKGGHEEETPSPVPTIECPAPGCILTFTNQSELEAHSKRHGAFSCPFCDMAAFSYAPDLALHEEEEHSSKKTPSSSISSSKGRGGRYCRRYACARCDYSTVDKRHYITHHLDKHLHISPAIPCPLCLKPVKDQLYKHMRAFHDISGMDPSLVSRCAECPAYFRTAIQLDSHKRFMHSTLTSSKSSSSSEKLFLFKCEDCGKEFSLRHHLRSHRLRKHESEADHRFLCTADECSKKYATQLDLDFHWRHMHKRANPMVECATCGKKYSQIGMKTHIRTHDPNRNPGRSFVCDQCGVDFSDRYKLETHLLSHSGPAGWKHSCPECGKKCFNKQALDVHLRTHTGEKPFICQVCGESYAHRHNLRNHVNSKHSDVMEDKAKAIQRRRNISSKKGIPYKPLFDKDMIQKE